MGLLEVDVNDTYDNLWDGGIATLVAARADVTVTVDGLATLVTGTLVHLTRTRQLVVDQRDGDDTVGTVVLVPLDRIVSVRAAYRQVDTAAERHARVEADDALLRRVRELAEPLADQVTRIGTGQIRGPRAVDLQPDLHEAGFDYDIDSIDLAIDILIERGDLPPRGLV